MGLKLYNLKSIDSYL